jgi:hypothetical protein
MPGGRQGTILGATEHPRGAHSRMLLTLFLTCFVSLAAATALLLVLETAALVLSGCFAFESCDVLCRVRSLDRLDYPNYEIVVIDNNTTDPAVWQPVAPQPSPFTLPHRTQVASVQPATTTPGQQLSP